MDEQGRGGRVAEGVRGQWVSENVAWMGSVVRMGLLDPEYFERFLIQVGDVIFFFSLAMENGVSGRTL